MSDQPAAVDPPKVPPTDSPANQPAAPAEPPKAAPIALPSEPGPVGPFADPGGMEAPQAPNTAPLRTEALPDGVTSTTADVGAGFAAPQAPGPEVRTDLP
jgi:hypothetical protein